MPNNDLPVLGERLKKARKDCGLTQEQLAERSGLSTRHIAKIENRKSSKAGNFFAFKSAPPRRTAFDICDIPPMSSHVSP